MAKPRAIRTEEGKEILLSAITGVNIQDDNTCLAVYVYMGAEGHIQLVTSYRYGYVYSECTKAEAQMHAHRVYGNIKRLLDWEVIDVISGVVDADSDTEICTPDHVEP